MIMTIYDDVQRAIYSSAEDSERFLTELNAFCDKWKLTRKGLRLAITLLGARRKRRR